MGHPPIEKLLPKSENSVYKLVRLAARRAAELASGRKPLVAADLKTKTATLALEEIQAGMVVLKEVADEFKPEKGEKPEPASVENAENEPAS
ncbi:MAG: DNA-directed RNA polymerase subunit omega [Candidatus Omnitrophota bacterium]